MKKLLISLSALLFLTSCIDKSEPEGLGVKVQKLGKVSGFALKACNKGNCNLSFKELTTDKRYIEPIKYHESRDKAFEKIMGIVLKDQSMNIISSSDNYIRAKQELYGQFISDIEFYFGKNKMIYLRIEMRGVPHDLGNGRRLLEKVRFKFQQNDF
jgi:uncharacterized protein (DUF1499 family)